MQKILLLQDKEIKEFGIYVNNVVSLERGIVASNVDDIDFTNKWFGEGLFVVVEDLDETIVNYIPRFTKESIRENYALILEDFMDTEDIVSQRELRLNILKELKRGKVSLKDVYNIQELLYDCSKVKNFKVLEIVNIPKLNEEEI